MIVFACIVCAVSAMCVSAVHCQITQNEAWECAVAYAVVSPLLLVFYLWCFLLFLAQEFFSWIDTKTR